MKIQCYIFTILLWILPQFLSAQLIRGQLIDKESEEPVAFASVFFSNTSIGTTSDSKGFFQLEFSGLSEVDLVVSHLGYELYSISLKKAADLPPVIYLSRIEKKLDEVLIQQKYAANRKRLLRRFEKAFLGTSSNRKKTKILNPESIIIRKQKDSLIAESLGPMKIRNEALGYELQFFLQHFLLTQDQSVAYKGKVLFEELDLSAKDQRKANKRRRSAYMVSPRHFYATLSDEHSKANKYEIRERAKVEDKGFYRFEPRTVDQLDIRKGRGVDTLLLSNHLSVVNKGAKSFWYAFKGENKYPTSAIRSLSGHFLISGGGILLNPEYIEEYGSWTKLRVAELLPLDYSPDPTSVDPAYPLIDSLAAHLDQRPSEKLYLHLNKYNFYSGESIWFRAYLVNGSSHASDAKSQVFQVELIDPNGKIIDSLSLHTAKATWGQFLLKPGMRSGSYLMRAYTQYMRNTSQQFFFQQYVEVLGKEVAQEKSSGPVVSKAAEKNPTTPLLSFYPEGGKVIEGKTQVIAFQLHKHIAEGAEIFLVDEDEQVISSGQVNESGRGKLTYQPLPDKKYRAFLETHEGKTYVELPSIQKEGYNLRLINENATSFRIKIDHSSPDSLDGAFLLGHVRGALSLFIEELYPDQIITIPKNTLMPGLVEFSLFDATGKVRASRLAFNEAGIEADRLAIEALGKSLSGDEIELGLGLADSIKLPGMTQLSVAVTEAMFNTRLGGGINHYLLIESDLGLMPGSLSSYFPISKSTRRSLDIFLMSWKQPLYEWDYLLSQKKDLDFLPQEGVSISGYTLDGENPKKRIQSTVMVNSMGASLFLEEAQTDEAGNFAFQAPLFLDSTLFIVQARRGNKQSNAEKAAPAGRRDVEIAFKSESRPKVTLPEKPIKETKNKAWETYAEQRAIMSLEAADLELDTVEIRGRRSPDPRLYNTYDLNRMDYIPHETRGLNLISMLKPGNRYELNRYTNKMYFVTVFKGEERRFEVTFVVNGLITSFLNYQNLSADMIDYVSINDAVISVQTRRNGPRSMEKLLDQGIKSYYHPGFHKGPQQFSPLISTNKSSSPPTRAHAIYWDSNIKFDATGKAKLKVPLPDRTQSILIKAEGILANGTPISVSKLISLQ